MNPPVRPRVIKRYKVGSRVSFVRFNSTADIFDTQRFGYHPRYRKWKRLRDLFPNSRDEQVAMSEATRIWKLAAKMLAEELLDGAIFVLPRMNTGYINIGDVRTVAPNADYDIREDGRVYGGQVILNREMMATNGCRRYRLWFTQEHFHRMNELRTAGKRYD